MGWIFINFLILMISTIFSTSAAPPTYPAIPGESLTCTSKRNQLEVDCELNDINMQLNSIISATVITTGTQSGSGVASNTGKLMRSVIRVQNDLISYSNRCYQSMKACSISCGQTFGTQIPQGTELRCYNNSRESTLNYNTAGQYVLQLCSILEQQSSSMGAVTVTPELLACARFRSAGAIDSQGATVASQSSTTMLNQFFSNENETIPSIIDPTSNDVPASVRATPATQTASAINNRAPASANQFVGLARRHGSDLIGVARSDLFLQIERRLNEIND